MRPSHAAFLATLALVMLCSAAHAAVEQKVPRAKRITAVRSFSDFHALADVAEVEPNNTPAEAQAVGCGNSLSPASLTNVSAVPDTDWISFTATAGDLITVETAEDVLGQYPTDTVLNLFAADGVTNLAVNDDDLTRSTLFSAIRDFEAPYTGLYYARIRGFNAEQGPYRANVSCAPHPPPPANDQCAGAILIPYGEFDLSGTTRFATNDYDLCPGQQVCPSSCTGFNSPGKDVVYKFQVAAGDAMIATYTMDPPGVDASLYLVTDCGDVQGSCVAGRDTGEDTPPETLGYRFQTAGTYYLILDAFTDGGTSWTLTGCLNCPTAVRPMTWGTLKTIYR